ncbi:MAG: hypothetical protein HY748_14345 [Elusimicrobia bacterium]|nr:hypothetical protein [Elusimicrobiota bacterium]
MNGAVLAGLLSAASLPGSSHAGVFSSATLKGFDVYRSSVVTESYLRQRYAGMIQEYAALRNDGRASMFRRAQTMKAKIEGELKAYGGLAFAEIHYGDYWTSTGRVAYVTFDLVDRADAAGRMPFKAAPMGSPLDPENLLAAWKEYSDLGMSLKLSAQLGLERPSCPAFYCTYGSATPELEAFEKKFVLHVPGVKKLLLEVLDGDAVPARRSAAMYLLSYLPGGAEVVGIALKTLEDPDAGVRGAALQVLSDIAVYRKDVPIDIAKISPALDYPTTSDRSKALGVLIGLADNPGNEGALRKNPPRRVLDLLKLKQPVCHDSAYTFLVMLTKETHDRMDFASWEKWLANPPPLPKKK